MSSIRSLGGKTNESAAYRISHDNASHPNEDRRDMHVEEHTVEIPVPKTGQDTLHRDDTWYSR